MWTMNDRKLDLENPLLWLSILTLMNNEDRDRVARDGTESNREFLESYTIYDPDFEDVLKDKFNIKWRWR